MTHGKQLIDYLTDMALAGHDVLLIVMAAKSLGLQLGPFVKSCAVLLLDPTPVVPTMANVQAIVALFTGVKGSSMEITACTKRYIINEDQKRLAAGKASRRSTGTIVQLCQNCVAALRDFEQTILAQPPVEEELFASKLEHTVRYMSKLVQLAQALGFSNESQSMGVASQEYFNLCKSFYRTQAASLAGMLSTAMNTLANTIKTMLVKSQSPSGSSSSSSSSATAASSGGTATASSSSALPISSGASSSSSAAAATAGATSSSSADGDKWRKNREMAALEILKTEETYKTSLVTIFSLYMIQCKRRVGELLTKEEFDALFGGIHEFIPIHKKLYEDLETRFTAAGGNLPDVIISDIFMAIAPDFLRYSSFINSFDKRLKLLQDLQNRRDKKFATFLTETMKSDHMKNMDLPAFLIQPVQRLPRYELLLRELCKFTPQNHVDYRNLEEAFLKIKETNALINQMKKDEENREKIVELESQMVAETAGTPRTVLSDNPKRLYVRSGDFQFLSATRQAASVAAKWKRKQLYKRGPIPRHCLLFDDQLIVTTLESKGKAQRFIVHHVFMLQNWKIAPTAAQEINPKNMQAEDFTMGITFTSEDLLSHHILFAKNVKEQTVWIDLLAGLKS